MMYRTAVAAAIVAVATAVLLTSCAPVHAGDYDGAQGGTALHVKNRNFSDAKLYVNGERFAFVNGNSEADLVIPRSRLDGEGCAVVLVSLMAGASATTNRECRLEGEAWYLQINPLLQTSTLTRTRA